jgi:flagellar motor component MotA
LQTTAHIVIIGAGAAGTALFTRPVTEMKCAGTPLKHAFLIYDIARRAGRGP